MTAIAAARWIPGAGPAGPVVFVLGRRRALRRAQDCRRERERRSGHCVAGRMARAVKLAEFDDHLSCEAATRDLSAPPYACARRHIANAQMRRGEMSKARGAGGLW